MELQNGAKIAAIVGAKSTSISYTGSERVIVSLKSNQF